MRDELERFVASLNIPSDRKTVVLAELLDHAACAREAAVREHRDPDAAERAAVGDLHALRRSLEAVEPAFRVTRRHALGRGVAAGILIAIVGDVIGMAMAGVAPAALTLAIGVMLAPPRALQLLRAELSAPRIRSLVRGVPIGPAVTYAFTVMATQYTVWIGLIVVRAFGGTVDIDVPWSAFVTPIAVYLVLLVEGIRARRLAVA